MPDLAAVRPRDAPHRCAFRAQLRGDPLAGTAFPAARVLLVEQPGAWGRAGLAASRFDPAVAAALIRRAAEVGVRVLAVRRPGRTAADAPRHWALADTRDGRQAVRGGTFDQDAELLDLALDATAGEPVDGPLFLVCAHSKRDACCAIRGRNVAAAFALERPGRVWECSHLGGDRFAANLLVLPGGLMYGRMLPWAAAEFVAACEAGEVVPGLLRGRVGLPPVTQAALAYAYEFLAVREAAAVRVVSTSPVTDGRAVVRLDAPPGRLRVQMAVERVAVDHLACDDDRAGSYLAYRPLSIEPD